jgi:hypothetical protein
MPLSKKSEFDHLVAESKQITADLVALRRDAMQLAQSRFGLAPSRLALIAERAYLTMSAIRAMQETLHDVWKDASGIREQVADDEDFDGRSTRALTSGQLRLATGSKR